MKQNKIINILQKALEHLYCNVNYMGKSGMKTREKGKLVILNRF